MEICDLDTTGVSRFDGVFSFASTPHKESTCKTEGI